MMLFYFSWVCCAFHGLIPETSCQRGETGVFLPEQQAHPYRAAGVPVPERQTHPYRGSRRAHAGAADASVPGRQACPCRSGRRIRAGRQACPCRSADRNRMAVSMPNSRRFMNVCTERDFFVRRSGGREARPDGQRASDWGSTAGGVCDVRRACTLSEAAQKRGKT